MIELSHLRRDTRTALELAVAALAPMDLIDRLAWGAGLLEAINELPPESPPVVALVPKVEIVTRSALAQWNEWRAKSLGKAET